jgi:hypothetical protein
MVEWFAALTGGGEKYIPLDVDKIRGLTKEALDASNEMLIRTASPIIVFDEEKAKASIRRLKQKLNEILDPKNLKSGYEVEVKYKKLKGVI